MPKPARIDLSNLTAGVAELPEVVALHALTDRQGQLRRERAEIAQRLNEISNEPSPASLARRGIEAEALALLDGGAAVAVESATVAEVEELEKRDRVLRAALQELEQRVQRARNEASRAVLDLVVPAHRAAVVEPVVAALNAAGDAARLDLAVRHQLDALDLPYLGRLPATFGSLLVHDPASMANSRSTETLRAIREGYAIPEEH